MTAWSSGLYDGVVMHQRLRPRRRRLSYRIFQMLFDLDELPRLGRRLRLFGYNRPGLLSFRDADHGCGDGRPLRPYVERQLRAGGVDLGGGPIRLLCMPRVLGQVFNPISIYFCHRPDGRLAAVLYEVNNTFGQRHSYLIPAPPSAGPTVRQACEKLFYVSPLMEMDLRYRFDLRPPAEAVFTAVRCEDRQGPLLLASFAGRRRELSDVAVLSAVARHPLLALKVVAAIHWEALKTWLSGARFQGRPPMPASAVTIAGPTALEDAA